MYPRIIAMLASATLALGGLFLHTVTPPATLPDSTPSPGYYEQWLAEHRNEQGVIPLAAYERWALADQQQIRAWERGSSPIAAVEQLAPSTPQGGRTRALLVDRRDSNRWWAGNVSGGLWRSDDAGDNWTPIDDGASTLAVSCLTQNPFRPEEIYYGTGEVRGSSVPPGRGVFKSTDGGLTFRLLPATNTSTMQYCNYMAHSLVKDSLVYVGTSNGLFVSRDAGTSWTRTLLGAISGIVCHPSGNVLVGRQNLGLYLSEDLGTTFVRITQQDMPGTRNLGRVLVENCRNQPDIAYAWFTTSQYQGADANGGLFRSADFGKTWVKMGDSTSTNGRVGATQAQYNQMLGVHPTNPDWLIIGAVNARKSLDGGRTFASIPTGHADQHTAIPFVNTEEMLVGNDGGIYRVNLLTNLIQERNTGYLTHQYYAGNFGPTGTITLGGTQDNGTWRHTTTAFKVFGADGGYAHISQQAPEVGYFSIQNGPVYRVTGLTTPRPTTAVVSPTQAIAEGVDFINEFQINYTDGQQLYYRTNRGLWRTNNVGATWMRLNLQNVANIKAVGVSPEPNPKVYIGGANVFYRIDSAATKAQADSMVNLSSTVPAGSRGLVWGNIAFHPQNPNTLFVGMSTMTLSSRAFRVDNADTKQPVWTDLTGNLSSELPIYYLQAHPDAPDQVLFAATAYGLYYTVNGGQTWQKETRMPNVAIFDMRLRTTDKTLFLFTHGRGVWRLPLLSLAVSTTTKRAPEIAFRVFPNPVTDRLRIQLVGEEHSLRTVQVFSVQGNLLLTQTVQADVAEIAVHALPAGQYMVRVFDARGRFASKIFTKT